MDGHLRLKAAQHLGLSEVPVVLADDLSDDQVRAFRIAVNRMAELADWDKVRLVEELKIIDVELKPLLGWDDAEIGDFISSVDMTPVDDLADLGQVDKSLSGVECPNCGHKF